MCSSMICGILPTDLYFACPSRQKMFRQAGKIYFERTDTMRLIHCHVENFGKLHDLTVEFEPDFHLISEPNGWGKSTLAAFIIVMFFGFEDGNRRGETESERKRFEPRQGGVYGGQITFETGGRTYTAARIFGDKKANDCFDLRDAQTNLRSGDFTENLGEEIFRINGESFARTILIGQNASPEDAIRECGEQEHRTGDAPPENRKQPERTFALSEQVSRAQDLKAKREEYDHLCADCTRTEEECRKAEDLFPNKVPTEEELQACLTACTEMDQAAEGMKNYALSEREQVQLKELDYEVKKETEGRPEKKAPSDVRDDEASDPDTDMPERIDGKREKKQEPVKEEPPQETRFPRAWLAFMIFGIIVVVIGLVIYVGFIASLPWLLVALAGVALIAVGRYLRSRSGKKVFAESAAMGQLRQDLAVERAARQESAAREEEARREAESRERDRINSLTRERMARRNTLAEKQQNYLASREQYEEKRTYVQEEIRRMGLTPEDELSAQITSIRRELINLENARKAAQEALKKKKEFEEGSDMSFLLDDSGADAPDGLQLDQTGLCRRLALVDAMYPGEKPFLILDDPFVNPDESSLEGRKRLMEAVTQHYQVICFTCREG